MRNILNHIDAPIVNTDTVLTSKRLLVVVQQRLNRYRPINRSQEISSHPLPVLIRPCWQICRVVRRRVGDIQLDIGLVLVTGFVSHQQVRDYVWVPLSTSTTSLPLLTSSPPNSTVTAAGSSRSSP